MPASEAANPVSVNPAVSADPPVTAKPSVTEKPPETEKPLQSAMQPTDVYAIHGADPEVLAYAMAKYSRSSLTMRESLTEISAQRAEQFLNTFYFQYGHRSIADLAHLAFAIERLSMLAAIELVDEQRWDGQERSTRYQDFKKSGWYTPELDATAATLYRETITALFAGYQQISAGMFEHLKTQIAKPDEMKQDAYERTLRARAFDVARYLLPLATNTSLGQIVNARTLEGQISRLLSDPHAEIRDLGERLRKAAAGKAWNVQQQAFAEVIDDLAPEDSDQRTRAEQILLREVHVSPTLVKYSAPCAYELQSRKDLTQAARELMQNAAIQPAPLVDLVEDLEGVGRSDQLEIDLAASLLYPNCHFSYRQLRDAVAALRQSRRKELVELGIRSRGRHDELMRAWAAGQQFRFDILMDIGGFRDMHRHRRCVQLRQGFTAIHGFALPEGIAEAGLQQQYEASMSAAHDAAMGLAAAGALDAASSELRASEARAPEVRTSSEYLLPMGTRCRSLFKMDFAEAVYISELRSQPQGHFSYRRVAWEMYQAVAQQYPALASCFRVADINEPVDLLKR